VPMIRIEKGNIMMHVDLVAEEKERGGTWITST